MATTSPVIRVLEEGDLPTVLCIAEEAAHNSWTRQVFEDCIKADYTCFVLEHSGAVVGYIVGLCHTGECQLMNIGVAKAHLRAGFARQLLQHLITVVREAKILHITLEVRASNMPAIRLYESFGFVLVGERQCYYPSKSGRENALIFFLNI